MTAPRLRPAIIFDCDGVLNEEPGGDGVLRAEDVRLLPGAGEAVRAAREAGCVTVMITNRAQVARGLVSFAELDRIFARIEALLGERGGVIDRIYFCPHHPDPQSPRAVPELAIPCECRKPGTLLFRRAFAELPIDVPRSAVIGDSLRDIGAGRAAGISAYGVRTGYGCRDFARYPAAAAPRPDLMFADVGEAVGFCATYRRLAAPLIAALPAPSGDRQLIVAIAGRAGAGKSALAHAAARALADDGTRCLHVRLDDWIVPAGGSGPGGAGMRDSVDAFAAAVAALHAGRSVTAPGLDPAAGGSGAPTAYDPTGCQVILVDGGFAGYPSLRPLVDVTVFVDVAEPVQRARFTALHRWAGADSAAIEALWAERAADEWPCVDAQRAQADLVLSNG